MVNKHHLFLNFLFPNRRNQSVADAFYPVVSAPGRQKETVSFLKFQLFIAVFLTELIAGHDHICFQIQPRDIHIILF